MSYFKDQDFQFKMLSFICKDRRFVMETSGLLQLVDFKPKRGDGWELYWIAKLAIDWWDKYNDPIGGMLRTEVLDFCRDPKIGIKSKKKLLSLTEDIKNTNGVVAVDAVIRKVVEYKKRRAKEKAINTLIDEHAKGELSDEKFQTICQEALKNYEEKYETSEYLSKQELGKRLIRRSNSMASRKYPYLGIDPLDAAVQSTPRKSIGLVLARYKVGKTAFLVWLAKSFACQGYNVLYYSLEEPKESIEDLLDSCISGVSRRRLSNLPKKVRHRFIRNRQQIKGRIKIVDGSEGGMSVARMESVWEKERARGYTADFVIIDYDDEIEPPAKRQGEQARRFEFADIYREMRRFAARKDIWIWTGAQAQRLGKEQENVRPEVCGANRTAEDISKMRKVHMCIGLGMGAKEKTSKDTRYVYIAVHRSDKQEIGFNIVGDLARGRIYDSELTNQIFPRFKQKGQHR